MASVSNVSWRSISPARRMKAPLPALVTREATSSRLTPGQPVMTELPWCHDRRWRNHLCRRCAALTLVRRRPPARQSQRPAGAAFLAWPSHSQLPGLEPHRQVRRPPRQPEDRQSATCLARSQTLLQEHRCKGSEFNPSRSSSICACMSPRSRGPPATNRLHWLRPAPPRLNNARQNAAGSRLFSHSLRLLRPDALCDLDLHCRKEALWRELVMLTGNARFLDLNRERLQIPLHLIR